ncbi:TonB-dependent receptor [Sphingomonas sp. PB4P5]|uniref:TonB-dependent receptor n=1 Tax=Parasphingomonas puruogangriensis TaxID=3096155 RepID=UPI002FC59188
MIGRSTIMAAAMLGMASPAWTQERPIDLPAGRLGDAVLALGRQAGTTIVVSDARLWARLVPAVRGRLSVAQALARLAEVAHADVRRAGPGWRLVPRARRPSPPPALVRSMPMPPVPAEEAQQPLVGPDIVVTASKRDVPARDFAGQAAILSGADLALGQAGGTDAILARLASVPSTHLGTGRNKLFIRGIADSSFTGPTQTTVGQYFGDLRLSYNAPDPDLRLYDIASVEVLEGPQGTLYGAGSLGGIIRTVPNAPQLGVAAGTLSLGASATQHGDPGADLGAMLNVPLAGGRLALRVVGYGVSEGGYIDNPLSGRDDINRTRIGGGRATLRLDAGNGWTVDLGGIGQWTRGDDSQYADRDAPPLTRASAVQQGFQADYRLGELIVSGPIGDLRFKSSTGIIRQALRERYDATIRGESPRVFAQQNDTALITSETRLWRPMQDRLGWVIGASFTHNRTRLSRTLGPDDAPVPVTGVTNRIDEVTLYGEASLVVTPGLTATAGLRATRADLSGIGEDVAAAVILAKAQIVADRRETSILPSASLIAALNSKMSVYARYQQGFRPGGLAIEADFVRRFRNDRVRAIEAGMRYGLAGVDSIYLSASASHTRWQDIQADFIDGTGLPSTENIGDGRIWTLSATAGWRPAAGLTVDLGFTYNDSRVTDPSAAFAEALRAADQVRLQALSRSTAVPNIARLAGRIGVDYRTPIARTLDLRLDGWARYVGRSRLGIGPVLGAAQGDYLDSALTARIGRGELGVTLGVTNLFDSVGNRFALGTPFLIDGGQITPQRPRTLRLGFDIAF